MSNYDKVSDKRNASVNVIADHSLELQALWKSDSTRPSIYTTESTGYWWNDKNLVLKREYSR